jgi:hypothetical protein
MRRLWDVTQRRKDSVTAKVTKKCEIPALVCSWKIFIRIETKEINAASTVHSQPVRSRFASAEMFIVGRFQIESKGNQIVRLSDKSSKKL